MNLKATWKKHVLQFKFDAGTSRGVLREKTSYFLKLSDPDGAAGYGECSILPGLSSDDNPQLEQKLASVKEQLESGDLNIAEGALHDWPAINFAIETALKGLANQDPFCIVPNDFMKGETIPINGLVWMGNKQFMKEQIDSKIAMGFNCIKLKIGALDFQTELGLLAYVRKTYGNDLVLRVDANGAFSFEDSLPKLDALSKYKLHSIEQPIRAGQIENMAVLCKETPVPIALDEELVGASGSRKRHLLEAIRPQFIILKPSLVGGLSSTEDWINLAESLGIGWWITSALESNIGLNAICQFTFGKGVTIPQGLGTGKLFHNNIESPLEVGQGIIRYNSDIRWDKIF